MDFTQIFSWYFWAEKPQTMQASTLSSLFVIFGTIVLIGIALHFIAQKKGISGLRKQQLRAFVKPTVMFGLLEIIYLGLHYEGIPLFSKRIWFLFIFLASVTWLAHRARLAYIIYPKKYPNTPLSSTKNDSYVPKHHNA